jgi:hypothetical protein
MSNELIAYIVFVSVVALVLCVCYYCMKDERDYWRDTRNGERAAVAAFLQTFSVLPLSKSAANHHDDMCEALGLLRYMRDKKRRARCERKYRGQPGADVDAHPLGSIGDTPP